MEYLQTCEDVAKILMQNLTGKFTNPDDARIQLCTQYALVTVEFTVCPDITDPSDMARSYIITNPIFRPTKSHENKISDYEINSLKSERHGPYCIETLDHDIRFYLNHENITSMQRIATPVIQLKHLVQREVYAKPSDSKMSLKPEELCRLYEIIGKEKLTAAYNLSEIERYLEYLLHYANKSEVDTFEAQFSTGKYKGRLLFSKPAANCWMWKPEQKAN